MRRDQGYERAYGRIVFFSGFGVKTELHRVIGGFYETGRAEGVIKSGVFFHIIFFAAVVQDGSCDGDIVRVGAGVDAFHVQQMEGKVNHRLGVAYEATFSQGVLGVVFARGAGRHEPETGGGVIQHGTGKGADSVVLDERKLLV